MIEIVNKLFQKHFLGSYYITDSALYNQHDNDKVIKLNQDYYDQVQNTLFKHFDYDNKPSKLEIAFAAGENDIANITLILNHFDILQELATKYCQNTHFFDPIASLSFKEINLNESYAYTFELNPESNPNIFKLSLKGETFSKEQIVVYNYLKYFNQLQTLIEVANQHDSLKLPLLKNPFAMISSMRQYGGFANTLNVGQGLNQQVKDLNHREGSLSAKSYSNTDYIFRITSTRLGQEIRRLRDKFGINEALRLIRDDHEILTKINAALKKHLKFRIAVESYNGGNDTAVLQLYQGKRKLNFEELSMGQKSIFYLLFAVYGYDVRNGILVIDEPELHLHTSLQIKYNTILKELQTAADLQIIIATHSGAFIDEKSIKNTYRFFKEDNSTSIVNPKEISQSQKDLIKILTYTNSSRVFFSDDVVLVEGDTDEYFFNFFYEKYIRSKFNSGKTLDILYIGGKGNFAKWREFLNLFRIRSYFIGDFDNIKEFKLLQAIGANHSEITRNSIDYIISKLFEDKIERKITLDGESLMRQLDVIISKNFQTTDDDEKAMRNLWAYLVEKQGLKKTHVVEYLHNKDSELLKKLNAEIEKLYIDRVYILKEGDLEDYLGITKDLSRVIDFCQNKYEEWIKNQSSKRDELIGIFESILKD